MSYRFFLICALACLPLALAARTKPSPPLDPDYITALATATNFLHAWQAHDEESGILLLSDDLRQHSSAGAVATFFSSHPQQTYEISHGRKVSTGRYLFPVTLWQAQSEDATQRPKSHATTLVVIRTAKADWLIDSLP